MPQRDRSGGDDWGCPRHGMRVYGRFQLEVLRDEDHWSVYRLESGTRMSVHDFIIPPEGEPNDIARYPDDVFHEAAAPRKSVRLLELHDEKNEGVCKLR